MSSQASNDLTEARLTFRALLERYRLTELAGGQQDAIVWLESTAIEFADSVSRRERFLKLARQVREGLMREQEERHQSKEPCNPYIIKRFRRFNI